MLKKTAIASAIGLIAAAGSLQADTPSFNYLQLDYIASGELQDDNFFGDDLDVESGYGIAGAFEIGEFFYAFGETRDLDYDMSNLGLSDSMVMSDMTVVGAGAHIPVAEVIELYGQIGAARVSSIGGHSGSGFGYELGMRGNVGQMVEVGLSYSAIDAEIDDVILIGDLDYLPALFNFDVVVSFAPDVPQLVLGYSTGTLEIDAGGGADAEMDMDFLSVGIRKTFN